MKERPILFSAPMVRAILAGQKTVTRRVVRGAPSAAVAVTVGIPRTEATSVARFTGAVGDYVHPLCRCPYGAPGDRPWVRETWRYDDFDAAQTIYVADLSDERIALTPSLRSRPSIHMPRSRSRLSLAVTDVRVERLHAITPEDAVREGVVSNPALPYTTARDLFRLLWDQINAQRAPWASNPWVWRVEFARVP